MFVSFWYGKYFVFCLGHLYIYKKKCMETLFMYVICMYVHMSVCLCIHVLCVYAIRFSSIYYVYYHL